ncbi:MAG: FtsX-like permease family protein [Methanomassiliicoccales archaeon]|nr:MAG: FtsX-like permease family protein [Methanomassiliicoccales archaeon]
MNKRIFVTTIGISLCVMYLVGTMTMVTGLHNSTKSAADMFEKGFFVVYDGYSLSESEIDAETIEMIPGQFAVCMITVANVSGIETRVLAIEDPHNILGGGNMTLFDEVLPGANFGIGNATKLNISTEYALLSMNITSQYKPFTSAVFPDNWILASEITLRTLKPTLEDGCSFIVVPSDNKQATGYLEKKGYTMMQSVSIVEFFELGFYQVEGNLWGVVISSAVIIVILIYNIMKIETQYRVPDIKIIKYLGASPRTVLYVFLSQALFISGVGSILGLALGIIAANAIVSLSQLLGFTSVLVPQVTLYIIGLPIAMALLAGLAGGFFPAYKASKTVIRTSREVL